MKKTVIEMLKTASQTYGDRPYTNDKEDNGYVAQSFATVANKTMLFASGLLEMGMQRGDKVSILAEGRSRWIIGEFGVISVGGINVPLSIKLLPKEVSFRVLHSDSKAIMLSKNTFDKLAPAWEDLKGKDFKIIYLDDDLEPVRKQCEKHGINPETDIVLFKDILQNGEAAIAKNKAVLDKIAKETNEDDIVSIMYTSGTTGNPKGIMLSHLNYYANTHDGTQHFKVPKFSRMLVILPLDHSFAHTVGIYASLIEGFSLYFVDSRGGGMATIKNIPINLQEAKPHFILTVPALTGNFMNKITDSVMAKGGIGAKLFKMGIKAGINYNGDGFSKVPALTKLLNALPYKIADALVFSKVRQFFGGHLRYCVGGGALLDITQQRFFKAIGVPVYQGYGLTESAPVISSNKPDLYKLGSSGTILPTLTCKIIDAQGNELPPQQKGEIVIRGQNVMKGYYKNPEASAEVLQNDWLHTGDLGYFDKDGFLMVVGREKALLISADGEKYSPEEIEEAIVNSAELIAQCMIYNDHGKYTTAVVTLNEGKVKALIAKNKITDPNVLIEAIKSDFYSFKSTADFKNKFPGKWIPVTFYIAPEPFSEANDMINSTLKMVRFKIVEAYKDELEYLYTPEGYPLGNPTNVETLKLWLPLV